MGIVARGAQGLSSQSRWQREAQRRANGLQASEVHRDFPPTAIPLPHRACPWKIRHRQTRQQPPLHRCCALGWAGLLGIDRADFHRRQVATRPPRPIDGHGCGRYRCPITNQRKGYPFEVRIPTGLRVRAVVLADQVKSLDWRARQAEFIGTLPGETVAEVLAKLATLLSGPV
jgi:mRNA interferase MazF